MSIIIFNKSKYFDLLTQKLYIDGEPCKDALTGIPYNILKFLAENSPTPKTYNEIRISCWGDADNTVGQLPQHISNLRNYIGDKDKTYIVQLDRGINNGKYYCTCKVVDSSELDKLQTNSEDAVSNLKEHHDGGSVKDFNHQETNVPSNTFVNNLYENDESFFEQMFSHFQDIDRIDMAYHSGYKWTFYSERVDMLAGYLQNGGKLRVIVNSPKAASSIAKHTNNPNREYIGFKNSIAAWKKLAQKYPGSIELMISDIPLLHSYVHFKFKNQTQSKMLVIFYTYGNAIMTKNYHLFVSPEQAEYELYGSEFEYLATNQS